jgi:hypothetical protein
VIWSAAIEDGLAALLEELLEVPAQWAGRPQRVIAGVSATLDVISEVSIGQAETERELVDGEEELTVTTHGLREATLQVSVWSPSQAAGESARTYTSRLRTRLGMPSVVERLRALELGIVSVGDAVQANVSQLGRMQSGSMLEIRVCFGTCEADRPVPYIESARIHTTPDAPGVENAAGDTLADSLQIDINPPEP